MRELSDENVKLVIYYHDKKTRIDRPSKNGGRVFLFQKQVDGNSLLVVAEIKDSECWLITSYEK
jgi:hypothetical protein